MKTIGLIGGLSWESTLDYYRYLNEETRKRAGNNSSARIIMYSVNFQEIDELISAGNMTALGEMMKDIARRLEQSGAECLMIGANTMHMLAPAVRSVIQIPLIHIAEETLKKVQEKGCRKVGLLGTKPTMEMDFYKRTFQKAGMEVLIPEAPDRDLIQDIIFRELFAGNIREPSLHEMLRIIEGLMDRGAEGVILGCTEIPLLVRQEHSAVPLFDTTYIHSCAAVDFALKP